jgi:NAD(P)-dependent dehydrogenase (short-subunit alcohol dehydrogenase family)
LRLGRRGAALRRHRAALATLGSRRLRIAPRIVEQYLAAAHLDKQRRQDLRHRAKRTEDHYDRTFDLNAKAAAFLVQKMLPMMGRGGSIILVASAMHYVGLANHSAYAASKAALRSYTRTWAAEFKDSGIRANTLSPGVVETPTLDSQAVKPEQAATIRQGYAAYTPMLRLAHPDELAAAALFLASDESSFMTGSDMVVDGG